LLVLPIIPRLLQPTKCRVGVSSKGSPGLAPAHVYVTRPPEKDVPALESLEDVLQKLQPVSEARADPTGRVVAVTFEGGQAEQQEIRRAIKEAGYVISRLSVRSDFPRGTY
jgi:copper chaperone CopZ